MLQTIAHLEALGLANTEAQVYIAVLQNPCVNGSQLTKQLDIPKPSIYLALDKLYNRGLINLIPSKSKQYVAQDVNTAFTKLRQDFNASLDVAINELNKLQPQPDYQEFLHIDGYQNYIQQFKAIIKHTKHEIYLHTNNVLHEFYPELIEASQRGVTIIIYAFGKTETELPFACELFYDSTKPNTASTTGIRTLAVGDNRCCLVASGTQDKLLSIYTENQFQMSLVAENIHNAIYWLKLYQMYPNFDYPCRLSTLAEQDIHISGYSI